jgi:iron complex transport system permease protein
MTAKQLTAGLLLAAAAAFVLGLLAGGQGWSFAVRDELNLILDIRAPRSLGAWCAGALLGLAGALAQGLFRNPLADPYLLGSAAGASLGVVLVLVAGGALGANWGGQAVSALLQMGLLGAAFLGALGGVALTLLLARGAAQPLVLLLAGVVVGVLLTAVSDLLTLLSPQALRGRQVFLLGTTSFLGWQGVAVMASTVALVLGLALRFAKLLDALVLGDDTASSLGLPLASARLGLVALMALATGSAVAQVGLVAFVGLVAPHMVRARVLVAHRALLGLSALMGGLLLLAADVAARVLLAPRELPVGLLTAVLGGAYLLVLMRRRWVL